MRLALFLLLAAARTPGAQEAAAALDRDLEQGAALARAHRYNAGLTLAKSLAGRYPDSAPAQQMLGFFQTKCQENVAAVRSYQRAQELEPDSPEITAGLGVAESAAGMEEEARRTLEGGIARFPQDPVLYQALGVVLVKLAESGRGDMTAAARMFEAALKRDPRLPEPHYQLGNLALAKGDLAGALEHLQAAAERNPADSRIHFALARVYRRSGNQTEAARETELFRRAKEAEQPR
jgi:Flp pilus assembly protein TadD